MPEIIELTDREAVALKLSKELEHFRKGFFVEASKTHSDEWYLWNGSELVDVFFSTPTLQELQSTINHYFVFKRE